MPLVPNSVLEDLALLCTHVKLLPHNSAIGVTLKRRFFKLDWLSARYLPANLADRDDLAFAASCSILLLVDRTVTSEPVVHAVSGSLTESMITDAVRDLLRYGMNIPDMWTFIVKARPGLREEFRTEDNLRAFMLCNPELLELKRIGHPETWLKGTLSELILKRYLESNCKRQRYSVDESMQTILNILDTDLYSFVAERPHIFEIDEDDYMFTLAPQLLKVVQHPVNPKSLDYIKWRQKQEKRLELELICLKADRVDSVDHAFEKLSDSSKNFMEDKHELGKFISESSSLKSGHSDTFLVAPHVLKMRRYLFRKAFYLMISTTYKPSNSIYLNRFYPNSNSRFVPGFRDTWLSEELGVSLEELRSLVEREYGSFFKVETHTDTRSGDVVRIVILRDNKLKLPAEDLTRLVRDVYDVLLSNYPLQLTVRELMDKTSEESEDFVRVRRKKVMLDVVRSEPKLFGLVGDDVFWTGRRWEEVFGEESEGSSSSDDEEEESEGIVCDEAEVMEDENPDRNWAYDTNQLIEIA